MSRDPLLCVTMLNTWLEPGIYKPRDGGCGCTLDVVEWEPCGMNIGRIRSDAPCPKRSHLESDFVQIWNPVAGRVA